MSNVTSTINSFIPVILIAMAVIIVLLFIVVIILFKAVGNVENKYRKLMRGASGKNIEQMLNARIEDIDNANLNSERALKAIDNLNEKMKGCVQKVSIVRYKAFEDIGSDLSFSIAMLDDNNDGIILTGIYGRQESTTYAKPIDKGISRYDLSEEEIAVLNEASNK